MRDELFLSPIEKKFEFDEKVAGVFDDMALRSIPHYSEVLKLGADFLLPGLREQKNVYDLGCSTGNFLLELSEREGAQKTRLIGIDNSVAMIERSRLKAKAYGREIEFIHADFLNFDLEDACAVVANYTIQFVRPMRREGLIKKIFDSLLEGGTFLMSEKVSSSDKVFDKQMTDRYHLHKKERGYAQNEIASKREALENVLVPYDMEENLQLLKKAGFESVEILFKWVNFCTFLARKK